jgi:hypothetical protein
MRTVGWTTGMTKLIVAFGNFANAPNRLVLLTEAHCSLWGSEWIFEYNVDYSSSSKGNFKALLRSTKVSNGEINLCCAYRSTSSTMKSSNIIWRNSIFSRLVSVTNLMHSSALNRRTVQPFTESDDNTIWTSWKWAWYCSKHVEDYNVTYILL